MNRQQMRGQRPAQQIGPSPLAARSVSDVEIFVAQNEGRKKTSEEVYDEGMEATGVPVEQAQKAKAWGVAVVTHETSDKVTMYKRTSGGWVPRNVSTTVLRQLMDEGWMPYCPDCGGKHGGEPNDCPARPALKFALCLVCGFKIWDQYQERPDAILAMEAVGDDPNRITFDEFSNTTPESRIRQALSIHIWWKHEATAREWGISAPAEPSAALIEAVAGKRAS